MRNKCDTVLYYAMTPLHIGIGRAPGTVDLPILRDLYGIPYLPGSSLKGTIKSACTFLLGERECWETYGRDVGSREPESISGVVVTDAPLLFYPARFETVAGERPVRLGYVSSPLQLYRAADLLEACGHAKLTEIAARLRDMADNFNGGNGNGTQLVNGVAVDGQDLEIIAGDHKLGPILAALGSIGHVPKYLSGRIALVSDSRFRDVVEAGLIRLTRVALDYKTKTVREGHLWSEEYVAEGAVFVGAFMYRDNSLRRAETSRKTHLGVIERAGRLLFVGGKETIGKGIVRLLTMGCGPGCPPSGEG